MRECREKWPRYATYDEDRDLRKEKWNEDYDGFRIVMWDNTNIQMFKSGEKLLYSDLLTLRIMPET